ncbi:hypothetical protein, partial [Clostridium tarantellae]
MENLIFYQNKLENICWVNSKEIKLDHSFLEGKRLTGFKPIYDLIDFLEKKESIDNDLILFCYKVIYCFKDIKIKTLDLHNYYKFLIKSITVWSTFCDNEIPTYDAHKKDMYNNTLLPVKESIYCENISSIQADYNNVLIKIQTLTEGILYEYKSIKYINDRDEINIFINKWTKVCKLLFNITNRFSIKVNSLGIHI